MPTHPRDVLFVDGAPLPAIPACEHYAGNEKFIRRAFAQQSETAVDGMAMFDVLCDLEDGAAAGAEAQTAGMVADLIASTDNAFGRAGVRVHDASHRHCMKDVEIVMRAAAARVAYFMLPKCEARMDALKIASWINHLALEVGVKRIVPLHVMIETHAGLEQVFEIVSIGQIEGVNFGIMDFVSSHQGAIPASAMSSPGQFDHPLMRRARLEISAAALAHGALPVQGVTRDFRNPATAEADARRAREEFGCLRMQSIHPGQIPAILAGMRPGVGEIETATEILLAAQAKDWGPIGLGGELHDRASYRYFWQLLERAHRTGAAMPEAARRAFFHH